MQLNLRALTFISRDDDTQDFLLDVDSDDPFPTPVSSGMEVDSTGPTLWCNFRSESGSEVNNTRFSYRNSGKEFNFRFHMKDSPAEENPFGHFSKRRRDKDGPERPAFELQRFTLSRVESYIFELSLELIGDPSTGPDYGISSLEVDSNNIIVNLTELDEEKKNYDGHKIQINFEDVSNYSIKSRWHDGQEEALGKISLHHN